MSILCWDKPKKAMSAEQWANNAGFDGGPPGGYVPNVAQDDLYKWRAVIKYKKTDHPQIEIRRSSGFNHVQLLVIVALDGYTYQNRVPEPRDKQPGDRYGWWECTKGVNVHMSMNGSYQMTFDEMAQLSQAIQEAKEALEALK